MTGSVESSSVSLNAFASSLVLNTVRLLSPNSSASALISFFIRVFSRAAESRICSNLFRSVFSSFCSALFLPPLIWQVDGVLNLELLLPAGQ